MRHVVWVVDESTEVNRMSLRQLLDLMKGPNLLAFVRRIRKSVREVQYFHLWVIPIDALHIQMRRAATIHSSPAFRGSCSNIHTTIRLAQRQRGPKRV